MGYDGHFPSTETPKECIERLWDYAVNGAKIAGTDERAAPESDNPLRNLLRSLAYCDWGDNGHEYIDQLAEEAAKLLEHQAVLRWRDISKETPGFGVHVLIKLNKTSLILHGIFNSEGIFAVYNHDEDCFIEHDLIRIDGEKLHPTHFCYLRPQDEAHLILVDRATS